MTRWFRLDADFAENRKVSGLSDRAFRFHVAGLCYCARNLTDGHISARGVRVVAAVLEVRQAAARTSELVAARLWHKDSAGDGYWINDYLSKQDSRAEADARSKAARNAARSRWGNADGIAIGNAQTDRQKNLNPRAVNEARPEGTAQEETEKVRSIVRETFGDAAA